MKIGSLEKVEVSVQKLQKIRWKVVLGPPNNFFLVILKKKLLNIFLNFVFYLKVQFFRLIMENNFIQTAASAGHAVGYTIGPMAS